MPHYLINCAVVQQVAGMTNFRWNVALSSQHH
jgi:hypothetical protein